MDTQRWGINRTLSLPGIPPSGDIAVTGNRKARNRSHTTRHPAGLGRQPMTALAIATLPATAFLGYRTYKVSARWPEQNATRGWAGSDPNPRHPGKSRELRAFGSIECLSTPNERIQSNSRYFGGPGSAQYHLISGPVPLRGASDLAGMKKTQASRCWGGAQPKYRGLFGDPTLRDGMTTYREGHG